MTKQDKVICIKPPQRIKFKSFCKKIQKKFSKKFIIKKHNKLSIDIPFLLEILVDKLKPKVNEAYIRNRKFNEIDFIKGIIDVFRNCTYWTRYNGTISGKYLNKRHLQYCEWGVYECLYRILLLNYFSTHKYNKLQYQAIDSTFIRNLYGNEVYGRNVKYKSKNGVKVSNICNSKGVPISLAIASANTHDNAIATEQIHHMLIETDTRKVAKNNKYSQTMLGDAGYHCNLLYDKLKKKGYKVVTDVNKRNTKNEEKLKVLENMKRKYYKFQSKRIIVENSFAWMHRESKINRFIEKSIRSYAGLLLLSCSFMVNKKLG
jgi:hypothetical protein